MGLFTVKGKTNVALSPEINVKGGSLFKPGFWFTRRVPRPPKSAQPHLSEAAHHINAEETFRAVDGRTYRRAARSNSFHVNAYDQFDDPESRGTYTDTRRNSHMLK